MIVLGFNVVESTDRERSSKNREKWKVGNQQKWENLGR
jgi:hypothetical protein